MRRRENLPKIALGLPRSSIFLFGLFSYMKHVDTSYDFCENFSLYAMLFYTQVGLFCRKMAIVILSYKQSSNLDGNTGVVCRLFVRIVER